MHSIYFNNRRLAVCSNNEEALNEPDAVLYSPGSFPELANLPELFDNSPQITKLYIPCESEEDSFKQLCTQLTPITAGGGVVKNRNGEYLLIFRHGTWDLPKGKQEPDEDIKSTALREVEEECGIHDLEINGHICDTFHTYHRDGLFYLKCTRWFNMNYLGNGTHTAPQQEEEIEKAIWVNKCDLPKYLTNTYPSIIEVLAKIGISNANSQIA